MVEIRLAKLEDCEACAKLSEIEELKTPDGEFISTEYFKENIDDDELFFVAEDEGKIVGYIFGEPMKSKMAYLSLLAVDKSRRGQGVGKLLLAKFEERCKELELNPILFYAPAFNENTIAFYNKRGYVQGKNYSSFIKYF